MMKVANCGDCRYKHTETSECHRYPPQLDANHTRVGGGTTFAWPRVTSSDWCGEFAPLRFPVPRGDQGPG